MRRGEKQNRHPSLRARDDDCPPPPEKEVGGEERRVATIGLSRTNGSRPTSSCRPPSPPPREDNSRAGRRGRIAAHHHHRGAAQRECATTRASAHLGVLLLLERGGERGTQLGRRGLGGFSLELERLLDALRKLELAVGERLVPRRRHVRLGLGADCGDLNPPRAQHARLGRELRRGHSLLAHGFAQRRFGHTRVRQFALKRVDPHA